MSDFRLWLCKFRSGPDHPEHMIEAHRAPHWISDDGRNSTEFLHLWGKLGGRVEEGILVDFVGVASMFGHFLQEVAIPDEKKSSYFTGRAWYPIYVPRSAAGPGHVVQHICNGTAEEYSSYEIRNELRQSLELGLYGCKTVITGRTNLIWWSRWKK